VEATARDLPPAVESELLAIAKEALTNVGKHANATEVELRLVHSGRRATLSVCDNGSGYRGRIHDGHGIIGMRERARLIGGSLRIAGNKGGTVVRVVVRLPKTA
jgi:signal transduction histidine kinase